MDVDVVIHEMRPVQPTAVHKTDKLAELVCSNSFRGDKLDNAVGLLKEEMRRLGSLIMRVADRSARPAGAALAVDRDQFLRTRYRGHRAASAHHRRTRRVSAHSAPAPGTVVIIATGPLTSSALSTDIAAFVGHEHLAFLQRDQSDRAGRVDRHDACLPRQPLNRSLRKGDERGQGSQLQALSPLSATKRSA
jgi:methylenetetrahydrofolate--tRNA-(uracil-5-)-methyltransferase